MTLKKTSLLSVLALSLFCSTSLQAMEPADPLLGVPLEPKPTPVSLKQPLISSEHDQKIINHLQSFNLNDQAIQKIWVDFTKVMPVKGPIRPLCLATNDPHFIALGLWRAHQEETNPQADKSSLSLKSILSCLLTKEFFSTNKKISLSDAQLIKSLIQSNPYFTTVEFFKAGITDNHLIQMRVIPHLQELSLEGNEITDSGIEILMNFPNLQSLNLAKNQITSKGVALLAKSPTLRHLNLYKNPTGDEGAELLSLNTLLSYLDLRDTSVGDKGAQSLAINNKTIRDLRLRYNKITDIGAEAFLNSHHLTHLELDRNQVSKDLVFFLEHLMPSNGYLNKLHDPKGLLRVSLPAQKARVRILSIDGGGIRGILPGGMLKYIEDGLTQKTGSQFYFAEHIDLMAGTSTGGIISLGLIMPGERGHPKYTTETLMDLYTTKGREIFPAPWCGKGVLTATYSPEPIEQCLETYFGNTFLSDSLCPTLITSFNLKSNESHIFDSLEAKGDDSKNFHIKGAGRATSAAPTYFPCAKIKNKLNEEFEFVDGGIYANNPTLLATQRAQQLYPGAKEYVIYSFGTGQVHKKSLSSLGNKGLLTWGVNIADVLMNNAAEYTANLIKAETQKDPRIKYIRIQPHIKDSEKEMDNVEDENIQDLLQTVQDTIAKEKIALDAIIEDFYKDFGGN